MGKEILGKFVSSENQCSTVMNYCKEFNETIKMVGLRQICLSRFVLEKKKDLKGLRI